MFWDQNIIINAINYNKVYGIIYNAFSLKYTNEKAFVEGFEIEKYILYEFLLT